MYTHWPTFSKRSGLGICSKQRKCSSSIVISMLRSFRSTYHSLCRSTLLFSRSSSLRHGLPLYTVVSPQFFLSSKNSLKSKSLVVVESLWYWREFVFKDLKWGYNSSNNQNLCTNNLRSIEGLCLTYLKRNSNMRPAYDKVNLTKYIRLKSIQDYIPKIWTSFHWVLPNKNVVLTRSCYSDVHKSIITDVIHHSFFRIFRYDFCNTDDNQNGGDKLIV